MLVRRVILGGPLLFTAAWLVLGWTHDGYSQWHGTISVLAAYEAPGAAVMVAGFLVQAVAMLVTAYRIGLSGALLVAGLLVVNGMGTVAVAVARTTCGAADAGWCPASAHPASMATHVAAATLSLGALAAAAWAAALTGAGPRWVSLPIAAVGTGLLTWFAVDTGAGWAEKGVVTLLIGWAAWLGTREA